MALNVHKRFRQGQILKLVTSEPISSQDELRRRLSHMKVRVTQGTLSRDMSELKLVKTAAGYKPLSNGDEAAAPMPPLGPRAAGFSGGPAPRLQLAGAEDAALGSATARRGAGRRKIQGSGRHDRRGRHGPGDHAVAPGARRRPETHGGSYSDERPATGRRSRSDGLCRLRAGPASPPAPENSKANLLSARELGAREVPHRDFSASARLGRSALQDVFGRCRGRRAERARCFSRRRTKLRWKWCRNF